MLHRTLLAGQQPSEAGQRAEGGSGAGATGPIWVRPSPHGRRPTAFPRGMSISRCSSGPQGFRSNRAQATAEQKALAELALKHYAAPHNYSIRPAMRTGRRSARRTSEEQALQSQVKALQAAQQGLLDKQRGSIAADARPQRAGGGRRSAQPEVPRGDAGAGEGCGLGGSGIQKTSRRQRISRTLAAGCFRRCQRARVRKGRFPRQMQSLPLLAQSVADFQVLVREYAALGDRTEGAAAQMDLGSALDCEGERAGGDKAADLLDQAVQAYRERASGLHQSRSAPGLGQDAR